MTGSETSVRGTCLRGLDCHTVTPVLRLFQSLRGGGSYTALVNLSMELLRGGGGF